MKKILLLLFISSALLLSSCGMQMIFAFRMDKEIEIDEIKKFERKNNIEEEDLYILSKEYMTSYLMGIEKTGISRDSLHFYGQPLQTIYFNSDDSLISFNANCLAKGSRISTKLDWNYNGIYDNFPPKSNKYVPNPYDTTQKIKTRYIDIEKDSIINYIKPAFNLKNTINGEYDFEVFVFCGLMTKGWSEDIIEIVQNNVALDSGKNEIKVHYIITDELYDYKIIRN